VIVRTRDPEVLSTMDVVVDVGAVYDPATHRYDHHQREFQDTMEIDGKRYGTRLSSAGLIYKFVSAIVDLRAGISANR
jgi:uncharacterized UPF0160 family protein